MNILTTLHRLTWRHPFLILTVAFITGLVCLNFIRTLKLDSSLKSLYPQNSPSINRLLDLNRRYGGMDNLVTVIDVPGGDQDDLLDFAEEMLDGLRALPEIESIEEAPGIDHATLLESNVAGKALLYLNVKELDQFLARITDASILARIKANSELLKSGAGSTATRILGADPLGLSPLVLDRFRQPFSKLKIRYEDGLLLSSEGDLAVILARPKGPSEDIKFCEQLAEALERLEKRAAEASEINGARVRYTGQYQLLHFYHSIIKHDLITCAWVSFLMVMVLYLVSFRRVESVFIVGLPLILTMVCTLSFAKAMFGSVNALTGICIALLIGLCVDFAVHLYHRYLEERVNNEPETSLKAAITDTGPAVFSAAMTTVVAFLALRLSNVIGLQDLGMVTAAGMLIGLISMFTVLPSMLAISGGMRKRFPFLDSALGAKTGMDVHLGPVVRLATRRPAITLAIGGALTLLALPGVFKIRFEDDFTRLRPQNAEIFQLEKELTRRLGSPLLHFPIIVQHSDPEAAWELARQVTEELREAIDADELSAFISPALWLPDKQEQQKVLTRINQIRDREDGLLDATRIRATLTSAYDANGLRVNRDTKRFIDFLEKALSVQEVITSADLSRNDLAPLTARYVGRSEMTEIIALSYASTAGGLSVTESLERVLQRMSRFGDSVTVPGARALGKEVKAILKDDFVIMVSAALAGIFIVVLLHFRSGLLSVYTLIPLLTATLWTLGAMGWFGIELNIMNVAVIPLILGIGIDDGIQVVHRFRTRQTRSASEVIGQTGMALVVTTLTTIVAFGSLLLAQYPGLKAFGLLTTLGVGSCLLASLVLLPALLTWSEGE
ncbi:MAG: MMPL family transporter [Planctomycetota bacterium]|nr:MMPL family transporter [Planctomycetota bacterium]